MARGLEDTLQPLRSETVVLKPGGPELSHGTMNGRLGSEWLGIC